MKQSSFLVALFLLSSAAVTAADAAKFEATTLQGTSKNNPALFQIDVATGKVWSAWGATGTTLIPVQDAAALPAGDYHLYVSSNPQADGTNIWMVNRVDSNTGRIWVVTGGGTAPLAWVEVVQPK
jgi:hypothetical protein